MNPKALASTFHELRRLKTHVFPENYRKKTGRRVKFAHLFFFRPLPFVLSMFKSIPVAQEDEPEGFVSLGISVVDTRIWRTQIAKSLTTTQAIHKIDKVNSQDFHQSKVVTT